MTIAGAGGRWREGALRGRFGSRLGNSARTRLGGLSGMDVGRRVQEDLS